MNSKTLFLSYNSVDQGSVRAVQHFLEERGISTFFDRSELVAGTPWAPALEDVLTRVQAVAVFLGAQGLGSWQKREVWFALNRQALDEKVGRSFPVIPVLLPDADVMPGFLFVNTWIDLRKDLQDREALTQLVAAVQGVPRTRTIELASNICPYRGLHPFREEDAAFFFGHEAFVNRLLRKVLDRNLVTLAGPSGSGKSSVVQAGLIPALHRQHPPSAIWEATCFTPGRLPFHRLATALVPFLEPDMRETDRLTEAQRLGDRLATGEILLAGVVDRILAKSAGSERLLVAVDRFEELFTLAPKAVQDDFVKSILGAQTEPRLCFVLTLRADFYERLMDSSRELSDLLEGGVVNLVRLTHPEMERAVTEPARLVGLEFESGLVGRIVGDVTTQPGNLPLMEFALTELWTAREGLTLTHSAYEAIGGVAGAIANRAESEYAKLTNEQQLAARRVFTSLVRVASSKESGGDTSQAIELESLDPAAVSVVEQLTSARLLVMTRDETCGAPVVRLAHEALLRHWARLAAWLDEDREFLLWRQRLGVLVDNWLRTDRGKGSLLRDETLIEAETWLARRPEAPSQKEREYIHASIAFRARDQILRARTRRRAVLALAIAAIAALTLAGLAGLQWSRSESQRQIALGRQLAAQAELTRNQQARLLNRSVLLAAESLKRLSSLEGYITLRTGASLLPRTIGDIDLGSGYVLSVGGAHIATAAVDGVITVWESSSRSPVARITTGGQARLSGLSPDGRYLVTIDSDDLVRIWDTHGKREYCQLTSATLVGQLAFSQDGQLLASAIKGSPASISAGVEIWSVADCQTVRLLPDLEDVFAVAFTPDGRLLATASRGGVLLTEVLTGKRVANLLHARPLGTFAFSPDGRYLATADDPSGVIPDKVAPHGVQLWEIPSGQAAARLSHGTDDVVAVAFSPDGHLVATAGWDNTARIWEVTGGRELSRVYHEDIIRDVAFSPDGNYLATASDDQTARLWEIDGGREVVRMAHNDIVWNVDFWPGGTFIISSANKDIRVWETSGATTAAKLTHLEYVRTLAFSPDGRYIATGSGNGGTTTPDADNSIRLWDVSSSRELFRLHENNVVEHVAFSPDGRFLAAGGWDHSIKVLEVPSGHVLIQVNVTGSVSSLSFDTGSRYLVGATSDDVAWVWEIPSGRELTRLLHEDRLYDVAISPKGDFIATSNGSATSSQDCFVRVWDFPSGVEVVRMAHTRDVWALAISHDSRYIASGGWDQPAQMWSALDGQLVERIERPGSVHALVFSPDGKYLAVSAEEGAYLWDIANRREAARLLNDGTVDMFAFSPDGAFLQTSGGPRNRHEVRIWEVPSGKEYRRAALSANTWNATISPDRRYLATSHGNTVEISLLEPEDLLNEVCARAQRNLTLEEWQQYLGDEPYRKTCGNLP